MILNESPTDGSCCKRNKGLEEGEAAIKVWSSNVLRDAFHPYEIKRNEKNLIEKIFF